MFGNSYIITQSTDPEDPIPIPVDEFAGNLNINTIGTYAAQGALPNSR